MLECPVMNISFSPCSNCRDEYSLYRDHNTGTVLNGSESRTDMILSFSFVCHGRSLPHNSGAMWTGDFYKKEYGRRQRIMRYDSQRSGQALLARTLVKIVSAASPQRPRREPRPLWRCQGYYLANDNEESIKHPSHRRGCLMDSRVVIGSYLIILCRLP